MGGENSFGFMECTLLHSSMNLLNFNSNLAFEKVKKKAKIMVKDMEVY